MIGICEPENDALYMTAYAQSHAEMKAVEDFEIQKQITKMKNQGNNAR